jgi:2-polyprenyl-3-methyl-5-hydroxy-6-metoxy-1,4-benzoquinol methylase
MVDGRQFRDAFYDDYVSGHQGVIVEGLSESGLDVDIVPRLPRDRTSAILDVGCGQGQLVHLLHRYGYRYAAGIDTSPEQVHLAHRLGRPSVCLGDLFEASRVSPGTYDAVTAVDVIEHFDRQDVQRVFQAFSDLLKPEGTFIFRTPNGSSPFAGRMLYGDLTHGVIYTQDSLEQVAHLTGFNQMQTFPARPSGSSLRRRFRRLTWRLLEPIIKAPLIIETGIVRGHIVTQNLVGVARKRVDNEPGSCMKQ